MADIRAIIEGLVAIGLFAVAGYLAWVTIIWPSVRPVEPHKPLYFAGRGDNPWARQESLWPGILDWFGLSYQKGPDD